MIKRIEPPCWWVGMNTPLQLMIYGEGIEDRELTAEGESVTVSKVRPRDNPHFLFADIDISPIAEPGEYIFTLIAKDGTQESFQYSLLRRRDGSATRKSYDASDLIYLFMPDRFAEGDSTLRNTDDTEEKFDRSDPFGRHGGDIQGIIDHLDYFVKLGVTTLWPTPLQLDNQQKASYHGYACADYYWIDPRFGTNDLYKEFVAKAHEKGLKVIMDVVLNHCGSAHWWMEDLPFDDWVHIRQKDITSTYRLVSINDPNVSPDDLERTVNGWFDKDMPDLGMENDYALRYFIQVYIWWIEWADLDGLRVDTYPYNDKYAASKWTKALLEECPNLNIVAECWHSSPAIVSYWDGRKVNPDGYCSHLPSIMDFPLQEAINAGLKDPRPEWDTGMNRIYEALAHDFLYTEPNSLLIFLDSHDIDRFADTVTGNPEKVKTGLTLLATLRGIPQLYYGTEFGFRTTDFTQGDGSARSDFPGGWKGDKNNFFEERGFTASQRDIFEYAVKLFNWRKTARAIHFGKTLHFLPQGATYSYFRYLDEDTIFVFINASEKTVMIDWDRYKSRLAGYSYGINVITKDRIDLNAPLEMEPRNTIVMELAK